jgi:hypothetical protein
MEKDSSSFYDQAPPEGAHSSEIMDHDELLALLRTRIRQIERWIADGDISYGDEQYTMLTKAIDDDWPYYSQSASVFGRIRVADDGDGSVTRDEIGPYAIPEQAMPFRSFGVEFARLRDGRVKATYLFGDMYDTTNRRHYYCLDEDIYSMSFDELAPESLKWQLERLVPTIVDGIDSALSGLQSLEDKIRALDGVSFKIDRASFDEYDIINNISKYLNNCLGIDHRIQYNVMLLGEATITGDDDEGNKVTFVGEIDSEFRAPGYVGPIHLAENHDSQGNISYIPYITMYLATEIDGDENDDELTMPLATLCTISSTRPKGKSVLRSLLAHVDLVSQTTEVADNISYDIVDERDSARKPNYYDRLRYLQTILDAAWELAATVANTRFTTQAEAEDSLVQVADAIEILFEDISDELIQHTYVADGIGIQRARYVIDGFLTDADHNPTGDISFVPDREYPLSENSMMESLFVSIVPGVEKRITQTIDEDGQEWYAASIDLVAQKVGGQEIYIQAVPGTSRVARKITVEPYIYIPLDTSASLKNIDLYDLERFDHAMKKFHRQLSTMPDLKPSYSALRKLQRALYHERDDGEFTELNNISLLHTLGKQGGGDETAAALIVDTLGDLFGTSRYISVTGEFYQQDADDGEPRYGQIAGIIHEVISVRPDSGQEEPMLVIAPAGHEPGGYLYIPLCNIQEFYF